MMALWTAWTGRTGTVRTGLVVLVSAIVLLMVVTVNADSSFGNDSSARPTTNQTTEVPDAHTPASITREDTSAHQDTSGDGGRDKGRDDSDEDDDEEDDDRHDPNERTKNVVVAAVPILLGALTVGLMCVFMFCCRRNSRRKQQLKYAIRQHRACMRPAPIDSDMSDNNSICEEAPPAPQYVTRLTGLPDRTSNPDVMIMIGPPMTMMQMVAPPSQPSSPLPPEDLPPSYDEVMRSESRRDVVPPLPARFGGAPPGSPPPPPPPPSSPPPPKPSVQH